MNFEKSFGAGNVAVFEKIHQLMDYHHKQLTEIAFKYKEQQQDYFEGNVYTFDGVRTAPFMYDKIYNIFELAKDITGDILEIGFNSGNSALVFLMANPKLHFYAVDICLHKYVTECVEYLNTHFGNRVTLMPGDSLKVMPEISRELGKTISVYHIDGWHAEEGIKADLKNCYDLAKHNSLVIVDDCENHIEAEYKSYLENKKIIDCPELVKIPVKHWPHRIGKFQKFDVSY